MARMHSRRRSRSGSKRPISRSPPSWVTATPEEVEELIVSYARQGMPPSAIGMTLRDQHGIPLVRTITGKSVSQILRERGLSQEIPEDLMNLIERARRMHVHLQNNRSDRYNKHRLQLVEAKIHRLVKYYKRVGRIPKDFQFRTLYTYA
ncbi:MAG: 30S ribosomal protein S15 [Thaumarchaeota archaeon]|nr:30S ribosomal protein S15 [Candidatus Calditenuaceae archaeon]MDW8187279.1 30S ribosomal protein S15 [Nitrososphaerota archaeon]